MCIRTTKTYPATSTTTSTISRQEESVFGPALLLILGRGIALAVTFVVPVILARVLDPSVFGTYRQLFLIFTTIYAVAQLGMAESLFYFLPSRSQRAGSYAGNAMLTLAAAGVGSFVLLAALEEPLAAVLANPALSGLGALLGCYLALMVVSAPLEIVLVSRKRHAWASAGYALSDVARAALTLLPVLIWRRLDALLIGLIACAALRVVATLVYCRREFGAGFQVDSERLGPQLRYALPLQLAVVLQTAQVHFHAYVVAGRFDPATFAIYAIGCLQIPLVDLMASSACNVMMVRMRERAAQGAPETMIRIWRETTRKLVLLLLPLLAVLWIVARDFLSLLFGEAYAASVPIFQIWLCGLLLAALPAHGPLRVLGDTRFVAFQTMVKLAIVVVFIDAFLSAFGLSGAVLVSLIATLVGKAMLLMRLTHLAAIPLSQVLPWRSYAGIIVSAAAAAAPAMMMRSITTGSVERLVVTGATYLIAYAVLTWCCGVVSPSEKRMVVTLGRRVLDRSIGRRSCPVA